MGDYAELSRQTQWAITKVLVREQQEDQSEKKELG